MLKKVLLFLMALIIIISIVGCSKPFSNTSINSSQMIKKTNMAVSSKSIVGMKKYLHSKGQLQFQGLINNRLRIHMELQVTDKELTNMDEDDFNNALLMDTYETITKYEGYYYYDSHQNKIRIEAKLYPSDYISIAEFDQNNKFNGAFGGFVTDKGIQGVWNNSDSSITYPFFIVARGSLVPQEVVFDKERIGSYTRKNSNTEYGAYLTIFTEADGKFMFNIAGNWNDHTGLIDGVAEYTNGTRKIAKFHLQDVEGTNLDMTFTFNGRDVEVTATKGIDGFAGANVSLTGTFQKE